MKPNRQGKTDEQTGERRSTGQGLIYHIFSSLEMRSSQILISSLFSLVFCSVVFSSKWTRTCPFRRLAWKAKASPWALLRAGRSPPPPAEGSLLRGRQRLGSWAFLCNPQRASSLILYGNFLSHSDSQTA